MVDDAIWNDSNDILAAVSDQKLVVWYYPHAAYVDRDLLKYVRLTKEWWDILWIMSDICVHPYLWCCFLCSLWRIVLSSLGGTQWKVCASATLFPFHENLKATHDSSSSLVVQPSGRECWPTKLCWLPLYCASQRWCYNLHRCFTISVPPIWAFRSKTMGSCNQALPVCEGSNQWPLFFLDTNKLKRVSSGNTIHSGSLTFCGTDRHAMPC